MQLYDESGNPVYLFHYVEPEYDGGEFWYYSNRIVSADEIAELQSEYDRAQEEYTKLYTQVQLECGLVNEKNQSIYSHGNRAQIDEALEKWRKKWHELGDKLRPPQLQDMFVAKFNLTPLGADYEF